MEGFFFNVMYIYTLIKPYLLKTVKLVLRGHLWGKKKWSLKTGDLLKEVQFI